MASPVYLERHARGAGPEQLAAGPPVFDAIVPNYVDLDALAAKMPKNISRFRMHAVMRSDDTTLTYHAVHAGMGVAFLPEWLVDGDLAAGHLVRVLAGDVQSPSNTLFAVYTSRQYMAPKLRTFIDFLSERLGR